MNFPTSFTIAALDLTGMSAAELRQLLNVYSLFEGQLVTRRTLIAARLASMETDAGKATACVEQRDELLADVPAVACLIRRSSSWVRKNGHTLPGFCQPGGRGAGFGDRERPDRLIVDTPIGPS